ncbi:ferric reductase-like transmembrane domain-containing protein [Streptomyces sp. MST-110588]|uniref:ferric reductase-like transmembrane domain-containing protein n=1 Tax=Streptomyces sp. MST-110588 TaxID=2833628 RepID=UPI001F5C5043|nr:ferric reductase-like transmembrane domain-containing protein [Streptomyces sp. MST-110588]UNO42039.1 hypothetical protein KGS77_24100 [Streptomyces sp. MST-110588]
MHPHRRSRPAPGSRLPGLPSGPRLASFPGLPRGLPRPAITAGTLALLVLPLLATLGTFRAFLDRTGGVLALVSLTAAVVWGLIASDRTLLTARSRLLAQAVHRAVATASLGFLLLHITVKISEGHARLLDALLPLTPFSASALIGLGALSGYLMVLAAATGALRSAFAGRGRASGRWRALHACAYPAWCLALLHGLKAGRSPSAWVTAGYALCLIAVLGALVARVLILRRRARGVRKAVAEAEATFLRPQRSSYEPHDLQYVASSTTTPLMSPVASRSPESAPVFPYATEHASSYEPHPTPPYGSSQPPSPSPSYEVAHESTHTPAYGIVNALPYESPDTHTPSEEEAGTHRGVDAFPPGIDAGIDVHRDTHMRCDACVFPDSHPPAGARPARDPLSDDTLPDLPAVPAAHPEPSSRFRSAHSCLGAEPVSAPVSAPERSDGDESHAAHRAPARLARWSGARS